MKTCSSLHSPDPIRLTLLICALALPALATQVERNVAVPMRDGVILRADVYRPDEPGPHPVLVLRTPYGKGEGKMDAYTNTYRYEPNEPVPTLWSATMFTIPADQAPLAKREDILVYQTEPLITALEVTGYSEVILHAASSAPDTDFFAKLIDVAPDGTNRDIASGMVRARYRDRLDRSKLIKPGEIIEYRIKLRPTSNEFQPGHRIRLDITSSDFPNYDRNHNTAADQNADARLEAAVQTVYHGGEVASHLILPVISRP